MYTYLIIWLSRSPRTGIGSAGVRRDATHDRDDVFTDPIENLCVLATHGSLDRLRAAKGNSLGTAFGRSDGRPGTQAIEWSTPRPVRRSAGPRQTADPIGEAVLRGRGSHTHQWALRTGHPSKGRPPSITFRPHARFLDGADRFRPCRRIHPRHTGALLHARLSNPDVQDPAEEVTGECV